MRWTSWLRITQPTKIMAWWRSMSLTRLTTGDGSCFFLFKKKTKTFSLWSKSAWWDSSLPFRNVRCGISVHVFQGKKEDGALPACRLPPELLILSPAVWTCISSSIKPFLILFILHVQDGGWGRWRRCTERLRWPGWTCSWRPDVKVSFCCTTAAVSNVLGSNGPNCI